MATTRCEIDELSSKHARGLRQLDSRRHPSRVAVAACSASWPINRGCGAINGTVPRWLLKGVMSLRCGHGLGSVWACDSDRFGMRFASNLILMVF
jgi:hypothetical protein